MTSATTTSSPAGVASLPATLRLGAVELTVADLARSVAWYERALGLRVMHRDETRAALGDGTTAVIELAQDPQAGPAGRHAGLYHYALLYPTRAELARAALRLAEANTPMQGASDHGTHEAIYLPDPDGNGIELAADRPRAEWPSPEEEYANGPRPLDFSALLATVAGERPVTTVGEGLRIGHVHLHVGDVAAGIAFYRDVLGFELRATLPSAAFVSAGGYHHHLAFNVWRGEGVGPVPPHTAGLRHWTVELDTAAEVAAVRARVAAAGVPTRDVPDGFAVADPWDIELRVACCGKGH